MPKSACQPDPTASQDASIPRTRNERPAPTNGVTGVVDGSTDVQKRVWRAQVEGCARSLSLGPVRAARNDSGRDYLRTAARVVRHRARSFTAPVSGPGTQRVPSRATYSA